MTTITRIVKIRPAGTTLKLHGAGDRLPWSPGPGAIPSEEPLLPRLETIIGMLASLNYSRNAATTGGCHACNCSNWCTCSLKPAAHSLCIRPESKIIGPFLVANIRYPTEAGHVDTRVYVNVTTGLLDTEGVNLWVEAAEQIMRAHNTVYPRTRSRLMKKARDLVKELMMNEGLPLLIPAEALSRKITKLSLNYARKTAEHGMIYSVSEIDILGGLRTALASIASVESVSIIILVVDEGSCISYQSIAETVAATLGPKGAPVIVSIESSREEIKNRVTGKYSITLTPAPILESVDMAIHPNPPQAPLEVYTRAFRQGNGEFMKDRPMPAYWPGTVLKGYENPATCPGTAKLVYALDIVTLVSLGEALKNITNIR